MFCYYSTESEAILIKSGALSTLLGLALADFGRYPRSIATVYEAAEFFCKVNNARFRRFPVGQISRNLNTTTSIGEALKRSEKNLENVTVRATSFFQKIKKITNFQCLATSISLFHQIKISGSKKAKHNK